MIVAVTETAEWTAVGAMAFLAVLLVRWIMTRTTETDAETLRRIEALEAKVQHLEAQVWQERNDKHSAMAEAAGYRGALQVVRTVLATSEACDITRLLNPLLDDALRRHSP